MSYSKKAPALSPMRNSLNLMVGLYATQSISWFDIQRFAMSGDEKTNEELKTLISEMQDRLFRINMGHWERNEKLLFDCDKYNGTA